MVLLILLQVSLIIVLLARRRSIEPAPSPSRLEPSPQAP